MGTIKVHEFVSLDGVFEDPRWTAEFGFTEGMGEAIGSFTSTSSAILLGRRTFEMFAPAWSTRSVDDDPGVPFFNDTPKYVVSSSLASADAWQNSSILGGYDAQAISDAQGPAGRRHLHQRQRHAGARAAGRRVDRRAAPARLPGGARRRGAAVPGRRPADGAGASRRTRPSRTGPAPDLRARGALTRHRPTAGAPRRARLRSDGRMTGWQMVAVAAAGFAAGRHQRRRRFGHPGHLPGAAGRRPAPGDRDHQQLPRPGARQPDRRDRLPPRAGRPAAAAGPAPPRLGARRADRRVPAAAPAGVELRGDRPGADRAGRRPGRHPAAAAARRSRGAAGRRRDAEQHIGPGRMAALFAGAYATGTYGGYFAASQGVLQIGIFGLLLPRVAATAQRDQERADHRASTGSRPPPTSWSRPTGSTGGRRRSSPVGVDRRRLHSAPASAGGCRRRSCGRRSSSSASSRSWCC